MKDIQLSGESWQGAGEEQEHSVEASGQIVPECSGCGEHLTLLGLEEDWPKEHRDAFGCSGCGNTVTLAERVDDTTSTIKSLLKNSIRPFGPGV
jgi:hypothetical protein